MKKQLIAAIAAVTMLTSALGGLSAGAKDPDSRNVSVYVNGNKIEDEYKPIIVNNRTLVRLVPIFDALGYTYSEMDANKSVVFVQKGSNATYKFTAESNVALIGSGGGDSYHFDVPATLQYDDVFYVPIRAFCEMVGLEIEWNDAARSVYITGNKDLTALQEKKLLTYEEAREIATKHVNDSDILLSSDAALVSYKGRQAYSFTLRSKGMTENSGTGTIGMTIYVYADNGEIEEVIGKPGN